MKNIIIAVALLILTTPVFACDEACSKLNAEQKTGKKLPGYLSWGYCDEIKEEFLTSSMRSLQKYNDKQTAGASEGTRRKAGMRNTQKYIDTRKDWLSECDNYLKVTDKGRIFRDDTTTTKIFGAMDSISAELIAQMKGANYTDAMTGLDNSAEIASEKFESLFTAVQLHVDKANLRGGGLYVTR